MTTPRLTPPTGCAVCGAPLPPRPVPARRFRRYCSDRCGHIVRKAVELLKKYQAQRDALDAKIAERETFLAGVNRTWH